MNAQVNGPASVFWFALVPAAAFVAVWIVLAVVLGDERIEKTFADTEPRDWLDGDQAIDDNPHLDPNVCRCEEVCIPALDIFLWELEVSP